MKTNLLKFNELIGRCNSVELNINFLDIKPFFVDNDIVNCFHENKIYFLGESVAIDKIKDKIKEDTLTKTNFTELPSNIQIRFIYICLYRYFKSKGFFYYKKRSVYLPIDKSKNLKDFLEKRNNYYVHQGFEYQIIDINNTYFLAMKPNIFFTNDGFTCFDRAHISALKHIFLSEHSKRFCGKNRKWLEAWVNFLKDSHNSDTITVSCPNTNFEIKINSDLFAIRG